MTRSIPSTFALIAGLATVSVACAAPVSQEHDLLIRKVAYTDAGLHTADGAQALARRVRVAASDVCGGENVLVRLTDSFKACRTAANTRAMTRLNAPLLADALGVSTDPDVAAR